MLIWLYELKNIWYGLVVAAILAVNGVFRVYECRALGMLGKLSRSTLIFCYSLPFFVAPAHIHLSACLCACVCVDVWILLSLAQYHHFIRLNSQRFKHHSYESIDSVQIVTLFRKHLSHTHYPSVRFYLPFFCENIPKQERSEQVKKRNTLNRSSEIVMFWSRCWWRWCNL